MGTPYIPEVRGSNTIDDASGLLFTFASVMGSLAIHNPGTVDVFFTVNGIPANTVGDGRITIPAGGRMSLVRAGINSAGFRAPAGMTATVELLAFERTEIQRFALHVVGPNIIGPNIGTGGPSGGGGLVGHLQGTATYNFHGTGIVGVLTWTFPGGVFTINDAQLDAAAPINTTINGITFSYPGGGTLGRSTLTVSGNSDTPPPVGVYVAPNSAAIPALVFNSLWTVVVGTIFYTSPAEGFAHQMQGIGIIDQFLLSTNTQIANV